MRCDYDLYNFLNFLILLDIDLILLFWHLFGIYLAFNSELFCGNYMKKMYPFSCGFLCERDILLVRDREEDMEIDRYVVYFGDFNVTTPQRRSSPHTCTLTH